jgi:hypothetical protein
MTRYSATERIGVNTVERIALDQLGWIFREQPIADMGIDAHIERVDDGNPTGKLVALQIKTGASHFRVANRVLIYYGNASHLEYWTGHSLPVLLVAHLPETDETLWVLVNEASVTRTSEAWKIAIPRKNVFGTETSEALAAIFEGSPSQQRFRKLSIDEPLMRHIEAGGKVSVDLEDWINKSLGRTPVKVLIHDDQGNETLSQDWFQYYTGYEMKELAEALFPWASASVDQDVYDEHGEIEDSSRTSFARAMDEDNGVDSDLPDSDEVYPYAEIAGEIEAYRLVLKLNELGRAFLTVSDHLAESNK